MRVACLWFDEPSPVLRVAEMCLRFSPQIAVRDKHAVFIEIGKCKRLYTEAGFLARLQVVLRRNNLTASVFIGSDITDSLALARYKKFSVDSLPLEALLDFADPFARDEVLQKSITKMISSFRDLGIKNVGDFKQIPSADLIGRFGVVGRHCYQRLQQESPIQWPTWKPEEKIIERKEFPYFEFYGELDPILFELKSQLDRIFQRLWARGLKVRKLQVDVVCEKTSLVPNPVRAFIFDFFAPQGATKGTLKILKERLSKEFEKDPIKSPIEALQTQVLATCPANPGQRNFLNSSEEKLEQLNSLHNQLIELCGKKNIFQAELVADRRPERSWKKTHDRPHEDIDDSKIIAQTPERPTFFCRTPLKVEVTAGFVHINKKRHRIAHWDPTVERINGGWIETAVEMTQLPQDGIRLTFDRNYYRVELEGGQKVFVFENPNHEFFLHGYYG